MDPFRAFRLAPRARTAVAGVQHTSGERPSVWPARLLQRELDVRGLSLSLFAFLALFACDDATPAVQTCGSAATPARPVTNRSSWPHEPPGFTTVSEVLGGNWTEAGWRCDGTGFSLTADTLVFSYAAGFPSGYAPGVAYLDLSVPTPETYFGFWWKPSDPWESHSSGVNKIALLFPQTSAGGTIYIMMFYDGKNYTLQVETTFASDTRRLEPNLKATPIQLGKWHQIEWYVRYSSSGTSRDGVVQWWLDGVPQGAYDDLQMPPPPDAGFIQYTIRPVWGGGTGDAKKRQDYYSYGSVHISKR